MIALVFRHADLTVSGAGALVLLLAGWVVSKPGPRPSSPRGPRRPPTHPPMDEQPEPLPAPGAGRHRGAPCTREVPPRPTHPPVVPLSVHDAATRELPVYPKAS